MTSEWSFGCISKCWWKQARWKERERLRESPRLSVVNRNPWTYIELPRSQRILKHLSFAWRERPYQYHREPGSLEDPKVGRQIVSGPAPGKPSTRRGVWNPNRTCNMLFLWYKTNIKSRTPRFYFYALRSGDGNWNLGNGVKKWGLDEWEIRNWELRKEEIRK